MQQRVIVDATALIGGCPWAQRARTCLEGRFEEFVELDLQVWRFREKLRRTVRELRWR